MPRGMLRNFVLGPLLLTALTGCGIVRVTSEGTHDPRGEPRVDSGSKLLDLDLTHRLMHFDKVQVFRVEEASSERCEPGEASGSKDVGCHRILDSVSAPTVGWARSMTSLVVWDAEYRDEDPRDFRDPTHAVRYVSSFGQTDVLFSLRRKWLVVISDDRPPARGSFSKSYERVLLLLSTALPHDAELRDLVAQEDSVRMDEVATGLQAEPVALWADCPPPPIGPMDYDDPPVPAEAPPPAYPEEAKRRGLRGKVVLHVFVEDDGVPCWVKVVSGDPILADAAVEAMASWRFHPAEKEGNRVGAWMEVPVEFAIQERAFRVPK